MEEEEEEEENDAHRPSTSNTPVEAGAAATTSLSRKSKSVIYTYLLVPTHPPTRPPTHPSSCRYRLHRFIPQSTSSYAPQEEKEEEEEGGGGGGGGDNVHKKKRRGGGRNHKRPRDSLRPEGYVLKMKRSSLLPTDPPTHPPTHPPTYQSPTYLSILEIRKKTSSSSPSTYLLHRQRSSLPYLRRHGCLSLRG